jgi:hypothetical protein
MSAPGLWDDAVGRLQSVGLHWATLSLIGTFILYVLGYLTIRFHLSVLGAGTDLGIIDERYLFAGAKFIVYLVSACVTLLLLLLLPAALCYAAYRLLSRRGKHEDKTRGASLAGLRAWCLDQKRLLVFGIVLAILFIQLVMKKCFFFGNLLMAQNLPPEPAWLSALVIGRDDALLALFFASLVATVAVTGGLLVLAGRAGGDAAARALFWLLAFLVAVQVLLLPINYGTLIADKILPKVASLDGVAPLRPGEEAWLVWEGNLGMTYLVTRRAGEGAPRSLVTLNRSDVKRVEIVGYDRILAKIFGGA